MIGRTISHYTIEVSLGQGGMGEVYRARDNRLGRSVAIKVLPDAVCGDPKRVRRFIKEAHAASALSHPNIVTIFEIDDSADVPFIVMEHIDGEALDAVDVPLSLERFLDYAIQITSALSATHEAGIVHRDIKPANIMVTRAGWIKVVDFGLARLAPEIVAIGSDAPTEKRDTLATAPGTILGTVGYMAPEQVQGQPADARADVFSIGVVFYELLTGRSAFRLDTTIATLASILKDDPVPIETHRDDLPDELLSLVMRCMSKSRDERSSSATEIHRQLVSIRDTLQQSSVRAVYARPRWLIGGVTIVVLLFAALGASWWRHESQMRWVRNIALPEIARLAADDDIEAAYRLARRAIEIAPDDPQLKQAWANISFPLEVTSEPSGASVSVRTYHSGEDAWIPLGLTPTPREPMPFAQLRFRLTLDGYAPMVVAPSIGATSVAFRLHPAESTPAGMVAVPGGASRFSGVSVDLPDFWIDRYEVTNVEYRKFVSDGGYRRPELWKHPIVKDGLTLSWEDAMKALVDETGQPGPAGWELGSYPEGQDDHPVERVSWYEAAAFAEYAGKSLPTVFHWRLATSDAGFFSDVLSRSNFSGEGTVAVGSLGGLGPHGTYDMAGNVREWCLNAVGDRRYGLGASWVDATYEYLEEDAQDPFERRPGSGFRLILQGGPISPEAAREILEVKREIAIPVDDATFAHYAPIFEYDASPLNARVDESDDTHGVWRKEKVSFDAAYGGERVPAYLFLPKHASPPYQTILFFPGQDAVMVGSSRNLWMRMVEFYIRSGRAVLYPVYKGTYERGVTPQGPHAYRELWIQRVKDIRRSVDYVGSRSDLDANRIAFHGISLGTDLGSLALAVEPRIKVGVFYSGGVIPFGLAPDVQSQNYLPRVRQPALLVTGRNDFLLPYETAQRPFFELLGTEPGKKRHVLLDGGHLPLQYNEAVREMLAWTDRWLGPVNLR